MIKLKTIYFLLFLLGSIVPIYFFGRFLNEHSLDPNAFAKALFATNPAANFSSQVFISCLVFWVYMFSKSKGKYLVRNIFLMILTFAVGLSSSLPLFLYFSEKKSPNDEEFHNT
jgi:Terpene cyclase DEP1